MSRRSLLLPIRYKDPMKDCSSEPRQADRAGVPSLGSSQSEVTAGQCCI